MVDWCAKQNSICSELIQRLTVFGPSLSRAVALAAEVDCLLSLAQCARDFRYTRPTLTNDNVLHIKQGSGPISTLQVPMVATLVFNSSEVLPLKNPWAATV